MIVYRVIFFLFLCLDYVEPAWFEGFPLGWLIAKIQSTSSKEIPVLMEGTETKITCESPKLYHQWYQWYQLGNKYRVIGNIPLQKGLKKTHFIINVEKFDNNTQIFCVKDADNTSKEQAILKDIANLFLNDKSYMKLFVANENQKRIEEPAELRYSETKNVSFSCEEYVNKTQYINVGKINMTSNILYTYIATSTNKNFNITDNGTVLCCIYYVVNGSQRHKTITRFVANKTLLLYHHDAYRPESLEGTGITVPDNKTFIIYVTSAVTVAIILLVIIIIMVVVYKKRYPTKSSSDTRVLYVDLDILRQPESFRRPDPQEESPYAQIIGEIRPPDMNE